MIVASAVAKHRVRGPCRGAAVPYGFACRFAWQAIAGGDVRLVVRRGLSSSPRRAPSPRGSAQQLVARQEQASKERMGMPRPAFGGGDSTSVISEEGAGMAIKDVLPRLRRERGLTQEDLAKKLFITRQAVSRWETGAWLLAVGGGMPSGCSVPRRRRAPPPGRNGRRRECAPRGRDGPRWDGVLRGRACRDEGSMPNYAISTLNRALIA